MHLDVIYESVMHLDVIYESVLSVLHDNYDVFQFANRNSRCSSANFFKNRLDKFYLHANSEDNCVYSL